MIRQWIAAITLASCSAAAFAQLDLPTRNIGGVDYYYRIVQKKETIYGIARELNIPKEDIVKYNPSVTTGLKKDQVLYFPVDAYVKRQAVVRPKEHKHTVKNGETLYGIAKMYGLSVAELLQANPQARTGLKADSVLTIPVGNDKQEAVPYTVKPGDTLYRLSVNFNVDLKDLLEMNPGVSPENFQVGMTVLIPPSNNANKENDKPETVFVHDKVEKGDSFESISEEYGITEEQLKEANPDVDKLKRGSYVVVPIANESQTDSTTVVRQAFRETSDDNINDCVNIAILFPFEAKNTNKSKQALFYRDFYRGALLAVNDLKTKSKLNLYAYDVTDANISTVLSKKEIANAHMIFAPSEDNLLKTIVDFGQKNGINVINSFSVNNDMCYNNNRFFQVNTPSSYMYSSVSSYVESNYANCEIVFLKDESEDDKPLIEYLKMTNLPKQTVNLSESNGFVCQHPTLFVPTSSSRSALKKLKSLVDELAADPANDGKFSILGYPEWSIYNEYENFLRANNVCLFSRYSIEGNNKFDSKYKYWYGESPINSIPNMSELGYDTMSFFINAVIANGNDFNKPMQATDGLEIGINIVRTSSWGGFVNTASFIYNYTTKGVEKHMLK